MAGQVLAPGQKGFSPGMKASMQHGQLGTRMRLCVAVLPLREEEEGR